MRSIGARHAREAWAVALVALVALVGLLAASSLWAGIAEAAPPAIEVGPDIPFASISMRSEYFVDTSSKTWDGVAEVPEDAGQFQLPTRSRDFEYGYSSATHWIRFRLANPHDQVADLVVEIGIPQLDQIDLYLPEYDSNGQTEYRVVHLGDLVPGPERAVKARHSTYPLHLAPGAELTFYVRARSSSVVSLPVSIGSNLSYLAKAYSSQWWSGLYYGVLLVFLVYNFFLYLFTREKSYFWYVSFTTAAIVYTLGIGGTGTLFFPGLSPLWRIEARISAALMSLYCAAQFARCYLGTKGQLDRGLSLTGVMLFLTAFVPWIFGSAVGTTAAVPAYLAASGVILTTGVLRLRAGSIEARFFMVAWGGLLVAIVIATIGTFGAFGSAVNMVHFLRGGMLFERTGTAIGLAYRLRVLKREGIEFRGLAMAARAETAVEAEERRRAEKNLHEREEELRQSQKMEAVGRLAGGVAHDFNNLLQVILGFTQMLVDSRSKDSPDQEQLHEIGHAGKRAAALTRQLLAFSRRQVLQPVDLYLNDLVENLLKLLGRLLGEDIDLVFRPSSENVVVNVDPAQFEQVVMNLCVNARDAMPAGGRLELTTRLVASSDDLIVGQKWSRHPEYVELEVRDNGEGVSPDVVPHIFEPFFTTKERGKGTGLGLATVYGILRQHEGMVTLESKPGAGAVFRVYLPSLEREAFVPEQLSVSPVSVAGATVLVAEDDEQVRALTVKVLRSAGFEVIEAANGQEAVEQFDRHAKEIELLLLDVVMPHLSGRQVLDRIRAIDGEIPVVFCSGYDPEGIESRLGTEEQVEILQKPYNPQDLMAAIRRVMGGGTENDVRRDITSL